MILHRINPVHKLELIGCKVFVHFLLFFLDEMYFRYLFIICFVAFCMNFALSFCLSFSTIFVSFCGLKFVAVCYV